MPTDPLDLQQFQLELKSQLHPHKPVDPKLTPWQKLLSEILRSDEPVPVPVDYALEQIFTDMSVETFCKQFNLEHHIVRYRIGDTFNLRAFYEFSFRSE